MKKVVLLAFVLMFLSTAVVVGFISPVVSYSAEVELPVHNIDSGKNFSTIQEAINDNETLDGHTIQVDAGTYHEHVVVNKSLTLVGENRNTTVIDGDDSENVIYVKSTSNVSITGFTIQRSGCACKDYSGIRVENSRNINVTDNLIIENGFGIKIFSSSEIIVARNDVVDNYEGINVGTSFDSVFYHNSFINNHYQAFASLGEPSTWDDGYPSGGNYWSNYNGTDFYGGSGQNETGSDGIGDEPRNIDSYPRNEDRFPLMAPISFFNVGTWNETTYYVHIVSNSTLSDFYFSEDDGLISFNVTGQDGVGFCRVAIPNIIVQEWWQGNYTVLVDGEEPIMMNNWTDGTYTYMYFTYLHSEHEVVIMPEFPTWTSMLLVVIVLTFAIATYKRLLKNTNSKNTERN